MNLEPLDHILDHDGVRPEYRRFCEHRKQHPREYPTVQDFALWSAPDFLAGRRAEKQWNPQNSKTGLTWCRLAILIIAARLLFNWLLRKPLQQLLQRRGLPAERNEVAKLLEEIWVTLGGTVLVAWSWLVALEGLGDCSLRDMVPCLRGWPFLTAPPILKMYYNVELAWYLHLVPKHRLGYGERDSIDMKAHHVATILLVFGSYVLSLHPLGVLVLGIFNLSNPLLHLAKIARQLDWQIARAVVFVAFAVVFFVSRVVVLPLTVMKYAAKGYEESMPHVRDDFPIYVLAFNVLLVVLYILNLIWMRSIVSILLHARSSGFQQAGHMAHSHDPTSRANAPTNGSQAETGGNVKKRT